MPAPLFKRFAPPTPATVKQPSSPSSSSAPVKVDAELSTEAATPKREKKSKKSSKTTEVVADPVEAQEDVFMEDAPTLETSKKSKKRKSEVVAEQEGQEDDVSKKHKAVFSKFEKASKLAEARKDHEEDVDEAQEPQEELHGRPSTFLNLESIANHVKISSHCHNQRLYQNPNSYRRSLPSLHGWPSPSPSRHPRPHRSASWAHNHTM
jgi:hypothetical protein